MNAGTERIAAILCERSGGGDGLVSDVGFAGASKGDGGPVVASFEEDIAGLRGVWRQLGFTTLRDVSGASSAVADHQCTGH